MLIRKKILKSLKSNLRFTKDAEFTIETTVTELTEEKTDVLIGDGDTAYERLKKLKTYEGVTVSMDLIYNYPGQTMESLMKETTKMCQFEVFL